MSTNGKKGDAINFLESIFLQGIRFQQNGGLKKLWKSQVILRHAVGAWFKRRRFQKREGILVPIAISFSPTMRCNLSCAGCYSRDYARDGELSLATIDEMLGSAEKMGVFLFVITGGEPLMREEILELFQKHPRLLFLMITNGTLIDGETAKMIARAGNIIPVVSLEGTREQTDARRGQGVYDRVASAMASLQSAQATFGFSAMVTSRNFETLSGEPFIGEMLHRGCALGFYTEYIPVGSDAQWELLMEVKDRKQFRERVLGLRRSKPIMLAHLPDDEYGPDGRCLAVTGGCVHINAQGYVEPCPFAHFARDNIREKKLDEIFSSPFLAQLRASEAVLRRGHLVCALIENWGILKDIAAKTGATPTDIVPPIK